jgi:hypothetical protein
MTGHALEPALQDRLDALVRERGREPRIAPPPRRHGRAERALAGVGQVRHWRAQCAAPGSPALNVPFALLLRGPLDVARLDRALRAVTRRHEPLRARFEEDADGLWQLCCEEPAAALVPEPAPAGQGPDLDYLDALGRALATEPFDLRTGPPVRLRLVRFGPDEHALVVVVHHIVFDGWSLGVLCSDLAAAYEALALGADWDPDPLPASYADFCAWQREWLDSDAPRAQLAYWRDKLAGYGGVTEVPGDRPRPAVRSLSGALERFTLSPALSARVKSFSVASGVTPFMTLLAAFYALLERYTGARDLAVGAAIANRRRPELEPLVGFFVNTLVLRTEVDPEAPFRELLAATRRTTLDAYAHQDVPFGALVEDLAPERSLARTPLFQVMFILQNAGMGTPDFGGLEAEVHGLETAASKYDLTVVLQEGVGGFGGVVEYDVDLYDRASVRALVERYRSILEGATQDRADSLTEIIEGAWSRPEGDG